MRALALLSMVALLSCASTPPPRSRDLPTGLVPLADLLAGCTPEEGADGQRFSCEGGVEVVVRSAADGEPAYRSEANARAVALGAQLVWDETVVPTEAESGLVERVRAFLPSEEAPSVTWLGATHTLSDGAREELSCAAATEGGTARCTDVMGALLARHSPGALPTPSRARQGPVAAFGRALSLPTTCEVESATKKSGAVRCDDGVRLTWSAHAAMDEAVQALHATLLASGDAEPGEAFACSILGEAAQCEARARTIAGVTYVSGEAVAVTCMGAGALRDHGACRALILAK